MNWHLTQMGIISQQLLRMQTQMQCRNRCWCQHRTYDQTYHTNEGGRTAEKTFKDDYKAKLKPFLLRNKPGMSSRNALFTYRPSRSQYDGMTNTRRSWLRGWPLKDTVMFIVVWKCGSVEFLHFCKNGVYTTPSPSVRTYPHLLHSTLLGACLIDNSQTI